MILDKPLYLNHLDGILSLFEKSFNRSSQREFFTWRYLDNPLQDLLVNVFMDNGIVANYSASPCIMNIQGCEVKTALSMTTMTHPEYMGRGLFTQLANQLYDHMKHQEYMMVWGFPNNQSHYTFISKLQWKDIYEIPTMRFVINKKYKDTTEVTTDNDFELNYVKNKSLTELIHVVKDKRYLNWRYAQNPINKYTNFVIADKEYVSSFVVVKQYEEQLDIVDFQARDKEEGFQLMYRLLAYASTHELEAINCWAPRHHFMHGICEKIGFTNLAPVTYLGARQLNSQALGNVTTMNYSDWFIQMGDSDVY